MLRLYALGRALENCTPEQIKRLGFTSEYYNLIECAKHTVPERSTRDYDTALLLCGVPSTRLPVPTYPATATRMRKYGVRGSAECYVPVPKSWLCSLAKFYEEVLEPLQVPCIVEDRTGMYLQLLDVLQSTQAMLRMYPDIDWVTFDKFPYISQAQILKHVDPKAWHKVSHGSYNGIASVIKYINSVDEYIALPQVLEWFSNNPVLLPMWHALQCTDRINRRFIQGEYDETLYTKRWDVVRTTGNF